MAALGRWHQHRAQRHPARDRGEAAAWGEAGARQMSHTMQDTGHSLNGGGGDALHNRSQMGPAEWGHKARPPLLLTATASLWGCGSTTPKHNAQNCRMLCDTNAVGFGNGARILSQNGWSVLSILASDDSCAGLGPAAKDIAVQV